MNHYIELLKEKNEDVELIDNLDEVPDLDEFDDKYEDKHKLIVFDNFINLKPKEMTKINKYLTSSRKYGFTCWLMNHNYTSLPEIITRNVQYYIIFKLNDNVSIARIIRNQIISDVDTSII